MPGSAAADFAVVRYSYLFIIYGYACVNMHVSAHACVHVFLYVYMRACMHACLCMCAWMHACVFVYVCMRVCVCMCSYMYMHVCIFVCVYVYVCVCMYTCHSIYLEAKGQVSGAGCLSAITPPGSQGLDSGEDLQEVSLPTEQSHQSRLLALVPSL